jgi:hypothetical protein
MSTTTRPESAWFQASAPWMTRNLPSEGRPRHPQSIRSQPCQGHHSNANDSKEALALVVFLLWCSLTWFLRGYRFLRAFGQSCPELSWKPASVGLTKRYAPRSASTRTCSGIVKSYFGTCGHLIWTGRFSIWDIHRWPLLCLLETRCLMW